MFGPLCSLQANGPRCSSCAANTIPGSAKLATCSNRHAFDALGRDLRLDRYTTTLPAMSAYRETFQGDNVVSLLALVSFAVALTLATAWLLDRRSRPGASM